MSGVNAHPDWLDRARAVSDGQEREARQVVSSLRVILLLVQSAGWSRDPVTVAGLAMAADDLANAAAELRARARPG